MSQKKQIYILVFKIKRLKRFEDAGADSPFFGIGFAVDNGDTLLKTGVPATGGIT